MHYKDGTEAKVGDLVKGTTYNTPKGSVHVGIMIGITPGSAACNCRVAILHQRKPGDLKLPFGVGEQHIPEGRQPTPSVTHLMTDSGSMYVHREGEDVLLVGAKVDYSQCDHLELVHRPE